MHAPKPQKKTERERNEDGEDLNLESPQTYFQIIPLELLLKNNISARNGTVKLKEYCI